MLIRILKRIVWVLVIIAALLAAWITVQHYSARNACDDGFAEGGERMQALVYCDYGTAEVLHFQDLATPTPDEHEILIKVHATAINPLDWHYMRGTPYVMRLMVGLGKPKDIRFGSDYAGTVAAVGSKVTRFKPGVEVFGTANGALGEYILVSDDKTIGLKPDNISFAEAAAVPIAAISALQSLQDIAQLQAGQKILINGASGGVGTFAVQIAKAKGVHVTGVSSARNHALVASIGADVMIDYKTKDFATQDIEYDFILDCVGNRTLADLRKVLKPDGVAVMIGGGGPDDGLWIGPLVSPIKAAILSRFVSQTFTSLMAESRQPDIDELVDMLQAKQILPVIDRSYPFAEALEAIRYLETGRARGKVIIQLIADDVNL